MSDGSGDRRGPTGGSRKPDHARRFRGSASRALPARLLAVLLCAALVTPYAGAQQPSYQPADSPGGSGELSLSLQTEPFRQQVLDFLADLDDALTQALAHPVIGPRLEERFAAGSIQVPFGPEVYSAIEYADADELDQLRETFLRAPAMLAAPAVLREVLGTIPAEAATAVVAAPPGCSDEYSEFQEIVARTNVVNTLSTVNNSLGIAQSIAATAWRIVNAIASTCESPFDIPLSSVQIPLIVVVYALKAAQEALDLSIEIVDFEIYQSERCIDSCVAQGFSDHYFLDTNADLVGKGCDNRDNNCAGGIDESFEDKVDPLVTIDDSLAERCFRTTQEAEAAIDLAAQASDDCSSVAPVVNFAPVPQLCTGFLTVSATDDAGNSALAPATGPLELTIDPNAPQIVVPSLAGCYPTVAQARSAFASTQVFDCTAVDSEIWVIENECTAQMGIEAQDQCGNRATAGATVRVDGTPPEVRIDELLIPTVDGLACLSSEAEAIESVRNATRFSDNCTPVSDLLLQTTASGTACDLTVTSTVTAQDVCGGSTSDFYQVRVDTEPPVVMCSVQDEILYPANEQLVDVGFSYTVTDNCGPPPEIEVQVTSDEPTAFAFRIQGDKDPRPDAFIDRDAAGNVQGIRLRAQRKDNGDYDGRVYRIRVIATDRCGLSSHADCFVSVPRTYSQGVGAVRNSGQAFDATVEN